MKKQILSALLIGFSLMASGCGSATGESGVTVGNPGLQGVVQKGPFSVGSNITIQELDSGLESTGTSFSTTTTDDLGNFDISNNVSSNLIEVIAQGYYFNEVSGETTDALLTLRSLSDVNANEGNVNVNVLTTLTEGRLRSLVNDGGLSFTDAKAQAESELVTALMGVSDAVNGFDTMDIAQDGDSNAVLLAVSASLQADNSIADLSELIANINIDFEDGTLDDATLLTEYRSNGAGLDLAAIRTNLEGEYGSSVTIPLFENFTDNDGDAIINRDDSSCGNTTRNSVYNNDNFQAILTNGSYAATNLMFIQGVTNVVITDYPTLIYAYDVNGTLTSGVTAASINQGARFEARNTTTTLNDVSQSATLYALDSSNITVTDFRQSALIYVDGTSTVTVGSMGQNAIAYIKSGGHFSYTSISQGAAFYYEAGAVINGVTQGAANSSTTFTVPTEVGIAEAGLEVDVSTAECVYGFESQSLTSLSNDALYVEHSGSATLTGLSGKTVYVQNGATLTLADSSNITVYAQDAATVNVTGSSSNVEVFHEDTAAVDLAGASGSGNSATEVLAVTFL